MSAVDAGLPASTADDHLFNENSAWNIAIGAGFAAAATLPRLAAGLLPCCWPRPRAGLA